jgi:hypothetical protein
LVGPDEGVSEFVRSLIAGLGDVVGRRAAYASRAELGFFCVITVWSIAPPIPLTPKPHPRPALIVMTPSVSTMWELNITGLTMQSCAWASVANGIKAMPAAKKTCLFIEISIIYCNVISLLFLTYCGRYS